MTELNEPNITYDATPYYLIDGKETGEPRENGPALLVGNPCDNLKDAKIAAKNLLLKNKEYAGVHILKNDNLNEDVSLKICTLKRVVDNVFEWV